MNSATVRSGHSPTSARLFNYLVGEREDLVRNFDAERLGGLEVKHQLEFGGLHDRQIGGLLALENPGGVNTGLAVSIGYAGPVAHQAAARDNLALVIHRRQRM